MEMYGKTARNGVTESLPPKRRANRWTVPKGQSRTAERVQSPPAGRVACVSSGSLNETRMFRTWRRPTQRSEVMNSSCLNVAVVSNLFSDVAFLHTLAPEREKLLWQLFFFFSTVGEEISLSTLWAVLQLQKCSEATQSHHTWWKGENLHLLVSFAITCTTTCPVVSTVTPISLCWLKSSGIARIPRQHLLLAWCWRTTWG